LIESLLNRKVGSLDKTRRLRVDLDPGQNYFSKVPTLSWCVSERENAQASLHQRPIHTCIQYKQEIRSGLDAQSAFDRIRGDAHQALS